MSQSRRTLPLSLPSRSEVQRGSESPDPLLEVDGLNISFPMAGAEATVVRDVSFRIRRGDFVGLVGESGSGKSITALSIMGLLPRPGRVIGGSIRFEGEELIGASESRLRSIRGHRIGIVFQEPSAALNPVFTIGYQLTETLKVQQRLSKAEAYDEALRLLHLVALSDGVERLRNYPHQLSGGQRQRVMIALALASRPDLLLADEPTTALDVTIQAQILELLEELRNELSLTVLLITHDLAVVAETCDRVFVMYAGEIVEEADVETLFQRPGHPYTQGLLASLPRLGLPAARGRLPQIAGQVPDPARRHEGCIFHDRCSQSWERCLKQPPPRYQPRSGHFVRCFLAAGSGATP